MKTVVHFRASDLQKTWTLHLWQGSESWDIAGAVNGDLVDFSLPETLDDLRKARFKFRSSDAQGKAEWESDDFIRHCGMADPGEVWCFADSSRLLYCEPCPAGVQFVAGDVVTISAVSLRRFRGGAVFAWNPHRPGLTKWFPETTRDDASQTSTFSIPLESWMTEGFNFKLVHPWTGNGDDWEPDSANRVWCPADGNAAWTKSGQVNLRKTQLVLTAVPLQVLYPATLANSPIITLRDLGERIDFQFAAQATAPYPASGLFRVGTYSIEIYPEAPYAVRGGADVEWSKNDQPIDRPFPADLGAPGSISRFILGGPDWVDDFPAVNAAVTLVIEPDRGSSSFSSGVNVAVAVGGSIPYETVGAQLQPDGAWQTTLDVLANTKTSVQLNPFAGEEARPYAKPRDWIDTTRLFVPTGAAQTIFTTEKVFGLTTRGKTAFAEPPDTRVNIMQAAFGRKVVEAGVFDKHELPHGATLMGGEVYFVLHAPHAVWAALVLLDENAGGVPVRKMVAMQLTPDALYWWCKLPQSVAPAGTRYRYALNDDTEVLDPAAREVFDAGKFYVSPSDPPAGPGTSWSVVVDVDAIYAKAHRQPWQTIGWESLVIYEMHARRFTLLKPNALDAFEVLTDELQPKSRLGKPGYLRDLPVTAFELLPVHEFKSTSGWGYNPSFFFAVESSFGGPAGLATFVNGAHACGKGVILDLVYNHMSEAPLVEIARDVYRISNRWGDGVNCGHPMTLEHFRQATIYLWHTFNLCGFRFDDTKVMLESAAGAWEFIGALHSALQTAATAEGRAWPYCLAENDREGKAYDLAHPGWNQLDGEWAWDEVYRFRDVCYDLGNGSDRVGDLKREMDAPSIDGRPFYIAVRHAENHDRVSEQNNDDKRVAKRAPFGAGLRMAKAIGAVPLLSNGVPLLFMGQEVGETRPFSFDNAENLAIDPQRDDLPLENRRVATWFRALMGLRNDPSKGIRGQSCFQRIQTGRRTLAFTCGYDQRIFVVATWGTPDQQQDSAWLGLPDGAAYKEIFNSSWPDYQVEWELEQRNGGYDAVIYRGQRLNLPEIGAIVLEKR